MQSKKQKIHKAFVSSTYEDLKEHRDHVIKALRKAGIFVDPMEEWAASNDEPKQFSCDRMLGCDLCILLVAFRRGHVPAGEKQSITQLEYRAARKKGIDVLVYLLDEEALWPRKFDELDKDPQTRPWRNELLQHHGVSFFKHTPESIEIAPALTRWVSGKADGKETSESPIENGNPYAYLSALLNECKSIEIRGLKVSDAQAHRLDIEKLYTPLHMTGSIEEFRDEKGKDSFLFDHTKKSTLDAILKHPSAVIIGDPGSGKSTFLKRIVTILTRTHLNEDPQGSKSKLGLDPAPIPILVRLFDLAKHIKQCRTSNEQGCPVGDDNPAWLFHYLEWLSNDRRWGLSREWFEKQCDNENDVTILLDGLDEAPDARSRDNIVRLVNKLRNDCSHCRFVVTSRPVAYEESVQLAGFFRCDIAPLDDEGVNTFLQQWCSALYYDTPESAKNHFTVLQHDVFARAAIRRMAANPVMLTALAVVHWNKKRLPEQRAELYESVIDWLLDSRDMKRPDRTGRDECFEFLKMIALAMQAWPGGRQQSLGRGEMIDLLAPYMKADEEEKRRSMAEAFIESEELDSGIIRARGNRVEFWHLTFMEYLAARKLAGMGDIKQQEHLLKKEIIDDPAWRETLLLFVGVLWGQGKEKVEGFFTAMLDIMDHLCTGEGKDTILSREARCFGLIGAMLRDLQPYDYTVGDSRFVKLRERIEGIFDADKAEDIAIKVRVAAADALGQAGDHRIIEDIRTEEARKKMFVEIPEGEFLMGAQKKKQKGDNFDEEAFDDEAPVHKVHLGAFAICRYPVTVSQYEVFVNEDGYKRDEFWKAGKKEKQEKPDAWEQLLAFPNRPVVGVSWYEATAFCTWARCVRLPTEAEWERAARGPEGRNRKYPWGNEEIDIQRANYYKTEIGHVSPAGCFPMGNVVWDAEKGLWLADMAGNVLEWCSDWFRDYRVDMIEDPTGPGTGSLRVLRGGSWIGHAGRCRCARRFASGPDYRIDDAGFRVVFVP